MLRWPRKPRGLAGPMDRHELPQKACKNGGTRPRIDRSYPPSERPLHDSPALLGRLESLFDVVRSIRHDGLAVLHYRLRWLSGDRS
jgi:hypothetical protein